MIDFAYIILFFPLIGFLINGLFRNYIPRKFAGIIGSTSVFLSFLFSVILFIQNINGEFSSKTIVLTNWLKAGSLSIPFEFLIDPLSLTMMLIVTGVGFLIHVYSIGYMHDDERIHSFFAQMNLFTFAMLLLVMGANYVILFIGWEGVGLCSYLLIGFWFKNNDYNYAARKAFIMNRIGDLGFLLGMILIYFTFGSLSFSDVFGKTAGFQSGNSAITWITLLLMIGALGKSAQIPLYTWLPDAMAGPTPVSALIHAATMVTAGIYMIARSNALYILAPATLTVIIVIGLFTAVFAASIGLFQNDIKKVLAYSTVSQLGYMFAALGLGAFSSAIFHLTTHAFFKALLFLGAGSVIHALHGEQDINKMGGLKRYLPVTYFTFFIATLAISGIPPFSGFFSKDEILAKAFAESPVLWTIGFIGAILTCFYMFRLFYLVFITNPFFYSTTKKISNIHESPKVMTIPLIVLAILSTLGGFLNFPALFGGNSSFAGYLSSVIPLNKTEINHSTEIILILISLLVFGVIIYFAFRQFVKKADIAISEEDMKPIRKTIYKKYYIDEIYDFVFAKPYYWLSENFLIKIEKNVIDAIVNGVGNFIYWCGNQFKLIQKGTVTFYLFIMVLSIIFILLMNLY